MEWRSQRCSRRSFPQVDRWLLRNQLVGQSSLDGRIQGFAQSPRKLGRQAFRNKRRVVLSYAFSGEHEGSNTDSFRHARQTRSSVETEPTATIRMFVMLSSSARKHSTSRGFTNGTKTTERDADLVSPADTTTSIGDRTIFGASL